jgi:tRNA dimethylallyltransferase
MSEIQAQGRIPLLVGGTMLYFRALQQGLAPLPSADPAVRQALLDEAAVIGWAGLHTRLARIDPEAAQRIHPNDPQRIQRALEVHALAGRPLSALIRDAAALDALPFRLLKLVRAPADRACLRERIGERFRAMLERGLVDEVARLRARGDLSADMPSMRAVGYRQVWSHLDGALGYDEMCDKGIVASRQLAKRQLTWLRAEGDTRWIDDAPDPLSRALHLIQGAIAEDRSCCQVGR